MKYNNVLTTVCVFISCILLFTGCVSNSSPSAENNIILNSWTLEQNNTPLLAYDDIGLQRWNYAAQEDERIAGCKPIAIIGSRMPGPGIDPSDTAKFAYLAFSPQEDEYPAGWRIVVLEVSDPAVTEYVYFGDQLLYTLYDGQNEDTDWVFGLNTTAVSDSEHFTSDDLNKISLSDGSAQAAFNDIKDELPEEMYPVALLESKISVNADYQILCATDSSKGNGDIYVVQLTVNENSKTSISACDRLNMPAYVNAWPIESAPIADEPLISWDTSDPALIKWLFENDSSFPFSNMLTFLPAYNEDNASDLLTCIINNVPYCNYSDYFSDNAPWYPQEHISWYLKEVFNITDAAWEEANENWIIANQNNSRFENGAFKGISAGMPGIGSKVSVQSADYDGRYWTITFQLVSDVDTAIQDDAMYFSTPSDIAVLEQKEINGQLTWTMRSLEKPPKTIYKNNIIHSYSYSWNTLENEHTIINDFADIHLPEALYFDYQLNYSDEGNLSSVMVNIGNHSMYEDSFRMIRDNDISSIDDAAEKCLKRRDEYYSGVQGYSVTLKERVWIGGMEFQHLEEKNPWHNDLYCDFYVGYFKTSQGNSVYMEWELLRSPNYGDRLEINDPRINKIIEGLVIH